MNVYSLILLLSILERSFTKKPAIETPCTNSPGKVWNTTDCSYCECQKDGSFSCFQRNIRGQTTQQCVKCWTIPRTQCDHCLTLFTRQRIAERYRQPVKDLSCIECNCGIVSRSHEMRCSYGEERSCHGVNECEEMVGSYSTGQLKYRCHNCIDASGKERAIYVPFRTWGVLVDREKVACRCTMQGEIICSMKRYVASFIFLATCRNCSYERAQVVFKEPKSCHLNGTEIHHQTTQYVQMTDVAFCLQCSCFFGQLRCNSIPSTATTASISSGYHLVKQQKKTCSGKEECKELMMDKDLLQACSNPLAARCPSSHPLSWTTKYCRLSCFNWRIYHQVIGRGWCDHLLQSTSCSSNKCPDKEDFLQKYGVLIHRCTNSSTYIWIDRLCDGVKDCQDASDESQCTTYYCRGEESKEGMKWERTEIGTFATNECHLVKSKNKQDRYHGEITRKCERRNSNSTIAWSKSNYCGCKVLNDTVYGENTKDVPRDINSLYQRMKKLHKYTELTPDKSPLEKEVVEIFRILFEKHAEINTTEMKSLQSLVKDADKIASAEDMCNGKTTKYTRRIFNYIQSCKSEFGVMITHTLSWAVSITGGGFNIKGIAPPTAQQWQHVGPGGVKGSNDIDVETWETLEEIAAKLNVSLNTLQRVLPHRQNERVARVRMIEKPTILEDFLNAVSMVSIATGLLILKSFKVKNTIKVIIHKNLMVIYLLSIVMYQVPNFIEHLHSKSQVGCFAVVLLIYYGLFGTLAWFLIEGIHLVALFKLMLPNKKKLLIYYYTLGYGLPLLILSVLLLVDYNLFYQSQNCLRIHGNIWKIKGPIAFLQSIEILLFCLVFRELTKQQINIKSTKRTVNSRKAFLILVPLFGLPLIFGNFATINVGLLYVYIILNSPAGLYLLVAHVFMDPQVRETICKFKNRMQVKEKFEDKKDDRKLELSTICNSPMVRNTAHPK